MGNVLSIEFKQVQIKFEIIKVAQLFFKIKIILK